jgi:hypothetical protein
MEFKKFRFFLNLFTSNSQNVKFIFKRLNLYSNDQICIQMIKFEFK